MAKSLTDAELLNRLANRPDALKAMGYDWVDMTGFFNRPRNIMLGDEGGVALFGYVGIGIYEGHYLFPRGTPGVIDKCRQLISQVFQEHDALMITGKVPVENTPARAMTRALGFTRRGTSVSHTGRSCVDYVLERYKWESLLAESSGAWARSLER